jgi:purine-nucleoside phosphorylase
MQAGEFGELPGAFGRSKDLVSIVLGSGVSDLAREVEVEAKVEYESIRGLPAPTVPGHGGCLIKGTLGGADVLVAQGRVHLYEGVAAREVAALVRLLHSIGSKTVIFTNAAGLICPDFQVGRWMLIRDHLNLTGTSPLRGSSSFVDMTEIYTPAIADLVVKEACDLAIPLHEGVYAGVPGPQYETPAEVRMLRTLGADAVGMSTVLEAIQARALGMNICGLSCLTNWGAGILPEKLSHADVLHAGQKAVSMLSRLLISVLPKLSVPL